jgi:hypothetical protein
VIAAGRHFQTGTNHPEGRCQAGAQLAETRRRLGEDISRNEGKEILTRKNASGNHINVWGGCYFRLWGSNFFKGIG